MVPSLVSTGPVSPGAVPQYFWSVQRALARYSSVSCPAQVSTALEASCPWWLGLYLVFELLMILISCNLETGLPYTGMVILMTGLIQVKEEGWTGFSEGWQGCSEGFPEGKA